MWRPPPTRSAAADVRCRLVGGRSSIATATSGLDAAGVSEGGRHRGAPASGREPHRQEPGHGPHREEPGRGSHPHAAGRQPRPPGHAGTAYPPDRSGVPGPDGEPCAPPPTTTTGPGAADPTKARAADPHDEADWLPL